MKKPLVSVKMITYNHAAYISQAIECVIRQKTNFPFELVIGEDCSTDGTRQLVFDYHRKYPEIIRVITSEANIGPKKNSYRTTLACQGKYIAFCEGDDYWHCLDKLQKQLNYLENNSTCGLVFSDYDFYFHNSRKTQKNVNNNLGYTLPVVKTIEQIVRDEGAVIRTCTIMVRRELYIMLIEEDPYLHKSEAFLMGDTQLFAEMAAISRVCYIPESMATYRILEESASRSNNPIKYWQFYKSASEMKLYLCEKYNLNEKTLQIVKESWTDSTLRLALYSRNKKMARGVKNTIAYFTLKDWIKYLGSGNIFFFVIYRITSTIKKIMRL